MGTWGTGILEDDVAQDTKDLFEGGLARGLAVSAATQRVLDDPPWDMADEEDAAVIYLTLATLQLERGILEPHIRDKVLTFIEAGVPLWRWEDAAPAQRAQRSTVVEALASKLLTYPDSH